MEMMEEIVINEEIEGVDRRYNENQYPTITLKGTGVYFNREAAQFVPRGILWGTTSEYVVALPAEESSENVYLTNVSRGAGKVTTFPAKLRREKKIREGTYRLYKYRNGIAFKRYEQIGEEK